MQSSRVLAGSVARFLPVGLASILVGVFVLGAATSSAQRQPASALAAAAAAVPAAQIAAVTPRPVTGFAPPAGAPAAAPGAPGVARVLAPALPSGPLGIPGIMLRAYKLAADRVGAENSACKLPWFLLAGIGRIESGHAGDGSVDASGTTINPIEGPVLDGTLAGNAVITDTDHGALDGDPRHDRAMGPMQFIPSTWAAWGSDGNGDGKADPNNIFDATYSAGRYLCAGVSDIMAPARRVSAILRYNNSLEYAQNVLTWALAYATGAMPTAGTIEAKRAPSTNAAAPVTAPSGSTPRPGTPAPGVAASGAPVPGAPTSDARFTRVSTAFTTSGTIAVVSPAGPVECTLTVSGSTSADGATATLTKATVSGANGLCGLARTVGLPWTLTPTGPTAVELARIAVDALGTRCGPTTVSGDLGGPLSPADTRPAPCTVRSVTLTRVPALALA